MKCPHCGAENRDGVKFCRHCGKPLPVSVPLDSLLKPCPYCGATLRAEARFCKQCGRALLASETSEASTLKRCGDCGAYLRPGARFCPKCGLSLTHPVQLPPVPLHTGSICPQCGTSIRPGARFCKQCGAPIVAPDTLTSQKAPHPTPPVDKGAKRYYSSSGHLLPREKIAGRYLITEKIAEGGMGAIYQAKDLRLDGKTVALKEMSMEKIPQKERAKVLNAFEREAELLASLRHHNLTRVTDRFEEQGRHYMVMEFIKGKTLDTLLKQRSQPFPEEQVLIWAEQLCDVLSFLHNQKPSAIIYRDIKPGNIMLVQDTDLVKLIDFGIARIYKPHKKKDTIPFGTEGYAPPEQYGGKQTDARADVYSLGVTLHQLLTLEDPHMHLMQLTPVRRLNRAVSHNVAKAIEKAIEAERKDRHQSMAEMWEALSGEPARWSHLPIKSEARQQEDPRKISGDARSHPKDEMISEVIRGQSQAAITRTLHFEPGDSLRLKSGAPWVTLSSTKVGPKGGDVDLTIKTATLEPAHLELRGNLFKRWIGWHTSQLVPTGQTYQTDVVIRSVTGGEERCPIRVEVQPTVGQQTAGWLGTIVAILVELGAAGGVVASLLTAAGVL